MELILKEDYVLAVCDGYKPIIIDYNIYNNMTSDELADYVNAMLMCQDIGDLDDWD